MTQTLARARVLYERGIRANDAGQPVVAARALRGAIAALDLPGRPLGLEEDDEWQRLRGRVLLAQALAEFERSGLAAAQVLLDQTLQTALDNGDQELEALTHSQRAMALGRSGDMHSAMEELERGVRLLSRLSARDQWVMQINRGMVRSHLLDVEGARRDFARAREVAHAAGLEAQEYMAAHNLGFAAYLAGDMPDALRLMGEADTLAAEVSRAVPYLDRGRVLLEAGLESEAEAVLTTALRLCTDRRQEQVRGEIELDLARAQWALGRPDDALRRVRSAERRFVRRSAPLWAHRARVLTLQVSLEQTSSPARVGAAAMRLAHRGRLERDATLTAHASLLAAQAFLQAGRRGFARQWLEAALPLRRTAALSTRLLVDLVDAGLAAELGDSRRAGRVLARAAHDLHRAQSMSASLDLRTARSVHGKALAELDTRLASGRGAAQVLARTERWRAATASMPVITPPADPELARLLTELRGLEEQLRAAEPDETVPLRAEEARVRHRIRTRDWQLRVHDVTEGPRTPSGALPMGELRAALAARHTDLVSYYVQDGSLHAVCLVGRRARRQRLGDAAVVVALAERAHRQLQTWAVHGQGPLGASVKASLDESAAALEDLLLPTGLVDRGNALVVVPTAALALLPWGLLPSRAGVPTTVATSARAWLAGACSLEQPRMRIAVGPDLPGALAEGRAVASIWGSSPPQGPQTAVELREALASADLVHVAAHGRHEPESPLFSSLRMSDGPLFAHELSNSGIRARHVILSACDVGRSTVRPGDEPLGLSACLLYLGAAAVVAPVCRVPDTVAAETMQAYHRHLHTGMDAAEALAAAAESGHPLGRAFAVVGSPVRIAGARPH
ncbi:CHAT domain-containing protein [Pedococcus sp. 5OH_020]|uniref:CHAT domain-containing protein n=1 Tax=Pedococcus sp. 5OH_020 TaxID=2989814 RepID=UPI0022E9D90F|nr:CHAT domain-containing protein [Pedococcus sp. 5OH_020]